MKAAWNFTLKIWKTKSLECLKTRDMRDGFGPNGEGKKRSKYLEDLHLSQKNGPKKEPTQKKENWIRRYEYE